MATRQSGLNPLDMDLHFVLFDGTSAFVGSSDDITEETEIIFKSKDFEECCEFCDEYNEQV